MTYSTQKMSGEGLNIPNYILIILCHIIKTFLTFYIVTKSSSLACNDTDD